MKTINRALFGGLVLTAFAASAQAAFTISYLGDADPTTQGFTAFSCCGSSVVGPIANDLGHAVWSIAGTSTGPQFAYYSGPLSAAQNQDVASGGYVVSLEGRVLQGLAPVYSEAEPYVIASALLDTGGKRFLVSLGLDAAGDTVAVLPTSITLGTGSAVLNYGPRFTLTGSGSSYHVYDLVFDPATSLADLYVDGTVRLQGYAGTTDYAGVFEGLNFGAWSGGQGNFASVRLTAPGAPPVPEPAVLAMLLAGLGLVGIATRRNRRAGG